ncbi:hypothetical protein HY969_02275 [Candidatus Kaiserbacteria bacterium]|nr:hypothetical protein [Candidatus Kaiserbacteria bacterium]
MSEIQNVEQIPARSFPLVGGIDRELNVGDKVTGAIRGIRSTRPMQGLVSPERKIIVPGPEILPRCNTCFQGIFGPNAILRRMRNVDFVNFLEVNEPVTVDFILKQSRGTREKGMSAVFEFKCAVERDQKEIVIATGDFHVFRFPESPAQAIRDRLKYGGKIAEKDRLDRDA